MIALIFVITLLFLCMVIAEITETVLHNGRPNFFYDLYVQRNLDPAIEQAQTVDQVLDIMHTELSDSHFMIWRQVTFTSFVTAIFTACVLRSVHENVFVMTFLSLFFCLMLFLSLISYHYYGSKNGSLLKCVNKIQSLLLSTQPPPPPPDATRAK